MKVSLMSRITRLAGAVAAIWLCYASPAWAGGGGADSGSLLASLSQICSNLLIPSCPQYPAYLTYGSPAAPVNSPATPIVVELAAWQNWNPDVVRKNDFDCFQYGPLEDVFYCSQIAVNATNAPASSPISGNLVVQPPSALGSLASLAFTNTTPPMTVPPLTVTQNSDPTATAYVYAVVETANKLDLFLENLKGPSAVTLALPLAVMAKGASTENSVVATLNIPPTCILSVLCPATVTVNLTGTNPHPSNYSAQSLGVNVNYFFGPTVHSPTPHSIYEVQIPLLMNPNTDPLFFYPPSSPNPLPQCANGFNPVSGICNAFSQTDWPNGVQLSPKILSNTFVGMAPSAAPQCPGPQPGADCPAAYPTSPPATQPVSPTFGFCASFSANLNNPNAAFYLAIGPDATTYISSPVNLSSTSPDAFPPGGPYPACPTS